MGCKGSAVQIRPPRQDTADPPSAVLHFRVASLTKIPFIHIMGICTAEIQETRTSFRGGLAILLEELRTDVLSFAKRLVVDGLAHGSQGNISARDDQQDLIAITPSAIPYEEKTVEDIPIINLQGNLVEGKWKPTSESPMHTLIYREQDRVAAVVHSHAPYASVFAIIHEPLPIVLVEGATCLGRQVPLAPYAPPGSAALGRSALVTMGEGVAVILANHGLLTVGESLLHAYNATLAAETTARLVILARSMNAEPVSLPADVIEEMYERYLRDYRRTPTD
jgi:ribulose-5-phosphate 4-epimerase/fuculose-1-phosphate aldolase